MSLKGNAAISGVGALATLAASIVTLPIVLSRVGIAAYGVWAIGQLVVTYALTVSAGLGPTVARFAAVADGQGDVPQLRKLLWCATAVYGLVATVVVTLVYVLSSVIISAFSIASNYRTDAINMVQVLSIAAAIALYGGCLSSLLAGLRRYIWTAVASIGSAATFLIAIVIGLSASRGVTFLAVAFAGSQVVGVALRLIGVEDVIRSGRPALPSREEFRRLMSFTGRMQVQPIATLVNNQSDRMVIGLISSPTTVGEFAVGVQLPVAAMLIAGSLLGPLASELARDHGARDPPSVFGRFRDLQARWGILVVGGTGVGCASLGPVLTAWLRRPLGHAALFGALTLVAFAANLLTGPATSYLRAIGKPGLEARYGTLVMTLNIALTVALALAIGPLGVVIGTLGACWISAPVFFLALHRQVAGAVSGLVRAWGRAACVAGAISVPLWFVERAAAHAMPRLPALGACGALSIAAAVAYGALLAPSDVVMLTRYVVRRRGASAPRASHQRLAEHQTGLVPNPRENDA